MEKIRFAVVGTGWRALFYVRIAKWLPERFELTGVCCRTAERAQQFAGEHGVTTFSSLDELLATKPDFVVSCVKRAGMADMIVTLLERGVHVLAETPYGNTEEEIERVIAAQKKSGKVLDVAEQYFRYPSHAARHAVIARGLLGEVVSCRMNMVHEYHGISLLRRYLGEENGDVTITARRKKSPIVHTGDRSGYLTQGEVQEETRVYAYFDYADGRLGIYDFAGTQYHSAIRSSHVHILGVRGEISDNTVRWVTQENRPMQEDFVFHRDLVTGTIKSIDLAGERVYENPFRTDVPMNEDEIAIAHTLACMGDALRGGERHYPLAYGIADAWMTVKLKEAADTGVPTQAMPR